MATNVSPAMNQGIISPIDALWSLYQSQSKRVRKAFRVRILAEEATETEKARMNAYERKLTVAKREAAHHLADTIRKGVADVHVAIQNNKPVGRNADDFLKEMLQETE